MPAADSASLPVRFFGSRVANFVTGGDLSTFSPILGVTDGSGSYSRPAASDH